MQNLNKSFGGPLKDILFTIFTGKGQKMKKGMLLTTALILSLIVGGCSDNDDNAPDLRVAAFRSALKNSGFAVSEGSTKQINPFQFIHDGVIDSCAGNNAGQPYKCFPVPLIPGEEDEQGRKEQGVFRLRPYEAIVYVGPTPPEGDYFSYTAFLWVRHHNSLIEKGDWLFAALGDPINNLTIKTEGGGSPFEKNTMIVFTPDEGIYNRILTAAQSAGYPDSMINLFVIPSTNPILSHTLDWVAKAIRCWFWSALPTSRTRKRGMTI